MRLGLSSSLEHKTPEEWGKRQRDLGCRAVNFPVDYRTDQELIDRYERAAAENGLMIAEVGAWCNPVSLDEKTRDEAIARCIGQLKLADRLQARCCVNVAGSRGKRWDGAYRENLTEETWDLTVKSIQLILDEAKPVNSFYTIEPMPWIYPMSPEEYLELIKAVDRPKFAVHMDVFNWITSPRRYLCNEEFMEECFRLLGPYIRSCHLKDVLLRQEFTMQLQETACGQGEINLEKYAQLIQHTDPEMPVIIEHLESDDAYLQSLSYVKKRFEDAGIPL